MGSKYEIEVDGGVIDMKYTGEVKVILRNHRDDSYKFEAGDRIPQLIVEKIQPADAMDIDELDDTESETQRFCSSDIGLKCLITSE